MAENFVADPMYEESETNRKNTPPITRSVTFGENHDHGHGRVHEPFDSERLPETLASEIQRFLLVANLIENDEPRIAYLCRFHAFEIVNNMDPNSTGHGVEQFKSFLLQRLEQDEETTVQRRKEMSDISELRRVYHAYKDYIITHDGAFDVENREKLINACRIASVLYEVNVDGAQLKSKKKQRKGGGNVGSSAAKLSQQIDRLIEVVESRNTPQSTAVVPNCTIPEVMQRFNDITAKLKHQIDCLIRAVESRNTPQSTAVVPNCSIPEVMRLFNGITAKLSQQIDRFCETVESRNTPQSTTNMPGCSIPEVMRLLNDISWHGEKVYCFATRLFMVKQKRGIFVALDSRARLSWLYNELQKEGNI